MNDFGVISKHVATQGCQQLTANKHNKEQRTQDGSLWDSTHHSRGFRMVTIQHHLVFNPTRELSMDAKCSQSVEQSL